MVARKLTGQKTYWHLLGQRRMPTQYELVTSKLLYYRDRGFEVETPVAGWYRRCQDGSPLRCDDWEAFADPGATTYASYVDRRRDGEVYLAGVLDHPSTADADRALPAAWLDALAAVLAPLRYPCHGLMMAAAYVGQMAPSGRIAVAAALQSADELRRVNRLAYRLAQLRRAHPGLGDDARARWEQSPAWQPARELIEHALVADDWGEAFAAVALAIKPAWDRLVGEELAAAAAAHGDDVTGRLLRALADDGAWHAAWAAELVRVAVAQRDGNRAVLQGWVDAWTPRADAAIDALAGAVGVDAGPARAARDQVLQRCELREGRT